LNRELVELVAGGSSLLLLPCGEPGSFPVQDHWFLRGGPAVFPSVGDWTATAQQETITRMMIELQHFDLAGPVVPQIDSMWANIKPILMVWDNHDLKETRTHGLLFEMPVGRGRILVSTLDCQRPTNAAGQWLLRQFLARLSEPADPADEELGNRNRDRLLAELSRNELELQSRDWKFSPDPTGDGETQNWHRADFDDSEWKTIQADRHWEGQGYESLDDWAWYRLRVPLDDKWRTADRVFLNFTGVDDHYRLFVNGKWVGSGGDVATKTTAFDERKSYDITEFIRDHDEAQIAVAVYDWFGAGGIFRPVTLSTQPLSEDRPWLK
jgi:hypothetical protein